jgi:phage-related protein
MNSFPTLDSLGFHARRSNHRAWWTPIYLETIVGSGERLCIGVAAADEEAAVVRGVDGLERLACVYGNEANVFIYASEVALASTERRLKEGIHSLPTWEGAMDGLMFGEVRTGAGESLEDVARTALLQCASLLLQVPEKAEDKVSNVVRFAATEKTLRRLENLVRDTVAAIRPDLSSLFGQLYRASDKARPTRIGFVGRRLTANFGMLVPGRIEPLVNQAKARLWDLTQLKSGAMADLFPQTDNMQFELLLHRVGEHDPQYTERQLRQIASAVLELEEEADKASIRCRPMYSTAAIADFLLAQEAA